MVAPQLYAGTSAVWWQGGCMVAPQLYGGTIVRPSERRRSVLTFQKTIFFVYYFPPFGDSASQEFADSASQEFADNA